MENQATKRPLILVVESDPLMLTVIAASLDAKGFRCFLARNHEVAKKATADEQFDLIVMSIDTQILQAAEQAAELRESQLSDGLPIVFLAPRLDTAWIQPLNQAGGVFCLTKPFDPDRLMQLCHQAIYAPISVTRLAPPQAHFANQWVRL